MYCPLVGPVLMSLPGINLDIAAVKTAGFAMADLVGKLCPFLGLGHTCAVNADYTGTVLQKDRQAVHSIQFSLKYAVPMPTGIAIEGSSFQDDRFSFRSFAKRANAFTSS